MPAPTERLLAAKLQQEGLIAERWSNGPHAVYELHEHPYAKVLVVAAGSVAFTMGPERRVRSMKVGDRLELPAHTLHSAVVGPDGVVCLEAHVRARSETSGPTS